jgi:hypothetical protein
VSERVLQMEVKASVKKALQEIKASFPDQLLSKYEQKMASCIPVVADSLTQLLYDCDNEALQVGCMLARFSKNSVKSMSLV